MNILIIGGAGVVGQKLAQALAAKGTLRGKEISRITLADVIAPTAIDAPFTVDTVKCDITDPASMEATITADTDVIYLLAAIVSGQAEAEFDLGWNINMHGTINVLERARALGTKPVVVFSSSMAVYGGDTPDPITDFSSLNPQTSYGAQKAIGEMMVTDYSRKGFIDGRAFRLPTISVRPGKPNLAASSFMSSIFREPLNGVAANCPVDDSFPHYYLSPRKCVENLIIGAEVPAEDFGPNRAVQLPGRMWTIRQCIDAMTAVAGPEAEALITWNDDPVIQEIVKGWRFDLRPEKALRLGMSADDSFEDNIRYYIEDDRP
ncbi:D-erythronate dehydrogenase [Oceanicola sp. 502str15]|uniref:D-erythronate dehydrogenase n=1 Tax=Oceanicola sp. 502str15 TaxID=2696061 RepID=UPI002095B01A|nr:D-erythronate dehydrogenase [Oceanicola sp. 502str15]MCO6384741.1 NAD-dependent epimerase/dehydratase family protein [Oceanicola sp. 502str15]